MTAKRKTAGRPVTLKDGQRINVYLDAASIRAAKKLGKGNVSEGIRLALRAILSTDTEVKP